MLIIAIVASIVFLLRVRRYVICKLHKAFSALRLWAIFLTTLLWAVLNYDSLHEALNKLLQQRANKTFRLRAPWLDMVVTSHPANIEHILKSNFKGFVKGENFQQAFGEFMGKSSLLANDGLLFKKLYNIASVAISSCTAKAMEETQEYVGTKLLRSFEKMEESVTDLHHLMMVVVFEIVCKFGLGVDARCVPGSELFVKEFDAVAELCVIRLSLPKILWKFMRCFKIGHERRLQASLRVLDDWLDRALQWRISHTIEGAAQDIISRMEALPSEATTRDLAVNTIVAAMDTAAALSWFFWCVCNHPSVEQKILEEITRIARRRPLHERGRRTFSREEMKEMQYLHATFNEAMRLYPPVPLSMVESTEAGVLPDGTRIRKGTSILIPIYAYGRCESVWGSDAADFRPERWLCDGKVVRESEVKFMAFYAGQRRCLGKEMAYNMMKCVASSLIMEYKMGMISHPPVVPKMSMTLEMKYGFPITLKRRQDTSLFLD